MRVSLIVAMAENRVIGRDNALPWRLPADLRHFRRLTTGHPIIMGRRSYE
ncbi:MAG TPA: dihydrofolate reductase, partial [Burkholderiales bacterium]|nr:dihydrofolate reductase [Burkholderiales bacterium]